jgi:hypothetical protein
MKNLLQVETVERAQVVVCAGTVAAEAAAGDTVTLGASIS